MLDEKCNNYRAAPLCTLLVSLTNLTVLWTLLASAAIRPVVQLFPEIAIDRMEYRQIFVAVASALFRRVNSQITVNHRVALSVVADMLVIYRPMVDLRFRINTGVVLFFEQH